MPNTIVTVPTTPGAGTGDSRRSVKERSLTTPQHRKFQRLDLALASAGSAVITPAIRTDIEQHLDNLEEFRVAYNTQVFQAAQIWRSQGEGLKDAKEAFFVFLLQKSQAGQFQTFNTPKTLEFLRKNFPSVTVGALVNYLSTGAIPPAVSIVQNSLTSQNHLIVQRNGKETTKMEKFLTRTFGATVLSDENLTPFLQAVSAYKDAVNARNDAKKMLDTIWSADRVPSEYLEQTLQAIGAAGVAAGDITIGQAIGAGLRLNESAVAQAAENGASLLAPSNGTGV